jgi:hypothetical protein
VTVLSGGTASYEAKGEKLLVTDDPLLADNPREGVQ